MASSKQKAVERNRGRHRAAQGESDLSTVAEAMGVSPKQPAIPPVAPPKSAEVTAQTKVRGGPSIRGLITGMVAQGRSNAEITEAVVAQFPTSQAAAKPSKHISFYRSKLKAKDPTAVPAASKAPPVVVTAKAGAAKQQVVAG